MEKLAPLRLGVLGSGKGSNYRAIQEAILRGQINAETRLVISDVETAGILEAARGYGVRAEYLPPGRFRTKLEPDIEQRVATMLQKAEVDLVVLAGYMRMVKSPLLDAFPGRIINIHPSLLPAFPGLEAWKQALAAGVTETGCTVHYVDAGMDSGPIIAQRKVPVLPGDTPTTLHARIQIAEHEIYPQVVKEIAIKKHTSA
jgi:phosphoribosylglycinamide formyltransferase-1